MQFFNSGERLLPTRQNMNLEIKNFILFQNVIEQWNNPVLRGFNMSATQADLDVLTHLYSKKFKNKSLPTSHMQLSYADMLKNNVSLVQPNDVGFKVATLRNGWGCKRYIFFMVLEGFGKHGKKITLYLQGYSDPYDDLTLDSSLRFYINSYVAINFQEIRYNNGQVIVEPSIVSSGNLLSNIEYEMGTMFTRTNGLTDQSIMEPIVAGRPEDVLCVGESLAIENASTGKDAFDTTVINANSALDHQDLNTIGRKAEGSVGVFTTQLMNSFTTSLDAKHDQIDSYLLGDTHGGDISVFANAISKTSSASNITDLPFFMELFLLRTDRQQPFAAKVDSFTIGELESIFTKPYIESRSKHIQGGGSRKVYHKDRTVDMRDIYVHNIEINSPLHAAIEQFIHSITGYATTYFMLGCEIYILPTNNLVASNIREEYRVNITSFTPLIQNFNYKKFLDNLKGRIYDDTLPTFLLNYNYKPIFKITYDATLGVIADVTIGNSTYTFMLPSFGDSTFSPLITTNRNLSDLAYRSYGLNKTLSNHYDLHQNQIFTESDKWVEVPGQQMYQDYGQRSAPVEEWNY